VQWLSLPRDFLRAWWLIVRFWCIFRELSIYNDVSWFHQPLYRILCCYLLKMLYEKNIRNNKTDIKKEKKWNEKKNEMKKKEKWKKN
jgi:hypothetical protein